jgi:hypothetical protein
MGLDEFRAAEMNSGSAPKIDVILKELSPERSNDLLCALEDRTISAAAIRRVLKGWGYPMSASTVSRYRVETMDS